MSENPLPEIERSVEVAAEPEEVWRRIVDGNLAGEWLGVSVVPRPGGAVTVLDGNAIGVVEGIELGRSITWAWRRPDGEPSQVTIAIEPLHPGARVTVTERMLEYTITTWAPIYVSQAA